MRGKKILSALIAAAMIGSNTGVSALAQDKGGAEKAKTYNYVALGDSIAAGYGLGKENGLMGDPALVITDKLLANPIKGAYPAIFTEKLKELGAKNGFDVNGTNLASTAFRAADIEKVIRQNGYKGEFATSILESFVGEGSSEVLTPYHDIYNKYLSEADLVSIQLGGNDIIMSIIPDMLQSENPVIRASAMSLMLTLFGSEPEVAIGAGLQIINENKENITADAFLEAANYMKNVGANAENLVNESAEHVKGVVKAVQEVNGDTDIALVSMFNPYRTAEESAEVQSDIFSVLGPLFAQASNTAAETEEQTDAKGEPTKEYTETIKDKVAKITELKEALDKVFDYEKMAKFIDAVTVADDMDQVKANLAALMTPENMADIKALTDLMGQYVDIEELKNILGVIGSGEDVSQLPDLAAVIEKYSNSAAAAEAKAIAKQIAEPVAMQMAGKNVDPQIKLLNEKLKAIAAETGAVYVDVYNISPETDFDPHPNANGHKEIADILFSSLSDMVEARMTGDEITSSDEDITTSDDTVTTNDEDATTEEDRTIGDVNGDGMVNVSDIAIAASHVKGKRALGSDVLPFADADHNSKVTVTDVVLIAAHVKTVKVLA